MHGGKRASLLLFFNLDSGEWGALPPKEGIPRLSEFQRSLTVPKVGPTA